MYNLYKTVLLNQSEVPFLSLLYIASNEGNISSCNTRFILFCNSLYLSCKMIFLDIFVSICLLVFLSLSLCFSRSVSLSLFLP